MPASTEALSVEILFPGGKRVDARVGEHLVRTDQPASGGGAGSAPAPYDLFLASVGTCAGIYALGFCQARGIPTEGLRLEMSVQTDASGVATGFEIALTLPEGFPEKYRGAIQKAVEGCKVKKTIAANPTFTVRAV